MEQWKDIPNFEGLYQASTEGRVRTHPNKVTHTDRHGDRHWKPRIMKPKWQERNRCAKGNKDARLELWKDGEHKTYLVARLVAQTWVNGYREDLTVNHIDGDTTNNKASNLEWVTKKENITKGFETGAYSCTNACTLVDEHGKSQHFRSMQEASAFLGRNHGYVHRHKNDILTHADGTKYIVRLGA